MSNQTETTIKTITNLRIYDRRLCVDDRLANARAAQENLQHIVNSIVEDKKVLSTILFNLNSNEVDVYELPINTSLNQSAAALATSYCIVLARVLLQTTSPEFSDAIRERFYNKTIISMLDGSKPPVEENINVLRSKFLNLLEIHGPIKTKSFWYNLWSSLKARFSGNVVTTA